MASIISKKVNGSTYYYLREMARVGGKPKMVSERYLGKAADIEAAIAGATVLPERTRHLGFGDLAGSLLALVVFIPILTVLSLLLLREQEV